MEEEEAAGAGERWGQTTRNGKAEEEDTGTRGETRASDGRTHGGKGAQARAAADLSWKRFPKQRPINQERWTRGRTPDRYPRAA